MHCSRNGYVNGKKRQNVKKRRVPFVNAYIHIIVKSTVPVESVTFGVDCANRQLCVNVPNANVDTVTKRPKFAQSAILNFVTIASMKKIIDTKGGPWPVAEQVITVSTFNSTDHLYAPEHGSTRHLA